MERAARAGIGRALRVGSVPYLVGRPLDCELWNEPGVEYVQRVPAELVALLRGGELDVALVSSIELFRAPGYRYLSDLAVAGAGFVASVQVFLRRPVGEVETIALDPASRAAATLVQVLLSDRSDPLGRDTRSDRAEDFERGGRSGRDQRTGTKAPRFVDVAPGSDPRDASADAWLAIGDRALREYLAPDAPPVFNPSEEWFARTGLPFLFAVWIVRPGVVLDAAQVAAFVRARERGRARVGELADEAARTWSVPLAACRKYLGEECRYEPGPDMERALLLFRDRAARLALCRADLEPSAIATRAEHVA
jgi:chorismate dehydratase